MFELLTSNRGVKGGFMKGSGFTTKMSEWKGKTGFLFSDVDYIRHLEAALRCACDWIADTPGQDFEKIKPKDAWFDYFLYEVDHAKNIEN